MTEQEMLEAIRDKARCHDRIERLQALDQARLATIAALEKTLLDRMTTIGTAQHHLEQAHQAVHNGDRIACLQHIADARAALA